VAAIGGSVKAAIGSGGMAKAANMKWLAKTEEPAANEWQRFRRHGVTSQVYQWRQASN